MTDKTTDQKLADLLIRHIDNPYVEPLTGLNIRGFYLKEAVRAVESFTDAIAERMLREVIDRYSMD